MLACCSKQTLGSRPNMDKAKDIPVNLTSCYFVLNARLKANIIINAKQQHVSTIVENIFYAYVRKYIMRAEPSSFLSAITLHLVLISEQYLALSVGKSFAL